MNLSCKKAQRFVPEGHANTYTLIQIFKDKSLESRSRATCIYPLINTFYLLDSTQEYQWDLARLQAQLDLCGATVTVSHSVRNECDYWL